MSQLMRTRQYRLMLNVIDGLPRNSHYGEAIAMDESLVDPKAAKEDKDARPSMREWSPEYELLAANYDRLNALIQIQSSKKLNLKPWPSPMTAAELVKQQRRKANRARLQRLVVEAQARHAAGHPMVPEARGFYQDDDGRWHRADGRFVSYATVRAATHG